MALERRDHRVDIGPAGRNIFISRDKQLQSRQAKRIKVLMRLVMVLVGLVVAVGVGLFVALYMVPYFQAEISLDSSSSAQGGGLSSLSQVEMPTYDSMGLPVYDDEVARLEVPMAGESDMQSGMCLRVEADPETFGDSRTCSWLRNNMGKYGFVFRYPADKEDYTGCTEDLTVIRYVGSGHATSMQQLSMCLEEYISYLSRQG